MCLPTRTTAAAAGWTGEGAALKRWLAVGLAVLLGAVALRSIRPAPAERRPNILLILTDDQSLDTLPSSPAAMPFLQSQLADPAGHWLRFPNAVVPTPLCCPSRATLLTGRYDVHTGVRNNSEGPNLDDANTLPVWLHDAGYTTGLFGKYLNGYPAEQPGDPAGLYDVVPPGWDEWFSVATAAYYDYYAAKNGARTPLFGESPGQYSTRVLTRRALRFVGQPSPSPFFLYLAYTAPHTPAPADPRDAGKLGLLWPDGQPASYGESDLSDKPTYVQQQARHFPRAGARGQAGIDDVHVRMENATLAVDRGIAHLWKALPDDTYVLFASDNGFLWGEHARQGKIVPYDESLRVPLTLAYKGPSNPLPEGATDDRIVLNVDYLPTLEARAGVTPGHPVEGLDFLTQDRAEFEMGYDGGASAKVPAWCGVRSLGWMYARYATGEEELYDEHADPLELQNLAGDPTFAAQVEAMRTNAAAVCTGGTYYPPDFPTFP